MLDSGAEGPVFKSQPRRCRVTVLGKLFTPIVPHQGPSVSESSTLTTRLLSHPSQVQLHNDCGQIVHTDRY